MVEEKNWYEHWFVIDDQGGVFDLDFTTSPSPLGLQDYFEQMFLNESECATPSWTELCGGRESKLNDYQITVFSARSPAGEEQSKLWSGTLKDGLFTTPSPWIISTIP